MSVTTESIHVRGVWFVRFVRAVDAFMSKQRFALVEKAGAREALTRGEVRRVALRMTGAWCSLADEEPGDLDAWGAALSRALGRSALAIWTWDGEASVNVKRWKHGRARAELQLLGDAYRGADAVPRAPAKVLWPWLPRERRAAILRDGVPLVEATPSTGDESLDELLAGFNEADDEAAGEDPDHLFVNERTSVLALGAAIGLTHPFVSPYLEPPAALRVYARTRRDP